MGRYRGRRRKHEFRDSHPADLVSVMEAWRRWPRRTRRRWLATTAVSWTWCLIPVATFGLGTVPAMMYAAVRKRSLWQWLAVAGYSAAMVALLATGQTDMMISIMIVVGFGHALAIRRWTFDIHKIGSITRLVDRQADEHDAHSAREIARSNARKVVESDPDLARQLQIGRVDIPDRAFPDGGLVDVNNVPAKPLADATGLSMRLARRIVESRPPSNGFVSTADISVTLDLSPYALDHVDDYLIFLPPTVGHQVSS